MVCFLNPVIYFLVYFSICCDCFILSQDLQMHQHRCFASHTAFVRPRADLRSLGTGTSYSTVRVKISVLWDCYSRFGDKCFHLQGGRWGKAFLRRCNSRFYHEGQGYRFLRNAGSCLQRTRRHNPENCNFDIHRRHNFKFPNLTQQSQ